MRSTVRAEAPTSRAIGDRAAEAMLAAGRHEDCQSSIVLSTKKEDEDKTKSRTRLNRMRPSVERQNSVPVEYVPVYCFELEVTDFHAADCVSGFAWRSPSGIIG